MNLVPHLRKYSYLDRLKMISIMFLHYVFGLEETWLKFTNWPWAVL